MSKSPNILVAVGASEVGHVPQQTYENIFTKYNMEMPSSSDADFFNNIAQNNMSIQDVSDFDIYGFIPGKCKYTYDYSIQQIVDFFQKDQNVEIVICDYLDIYNQFKVHQYTHPSKIVNIPFFIRNSIRNQLNFTDNENSIFQQQLVELQKKHIIFHIGEPLLSLVQEGNE